MSYEHHQTLIQGLAGALKGLRLYPIQHPAIEQRTRDLQNAFTQLFSHQEVIRMGLLEGTLFVEDSLFPDDNPAAIEMTGILDNLEIEGLEFFSGLGKDEIEHFLEIISKPPGKGDDFISFMLENGPEHIKVASVETVDDAKESDSPRKVYGKALKVINTIFDDVRMGRIPSSDEAVGVVKNMARLTLEDPHALFALSLLKDYDNYTFTHSVNVSVLALSVGRACACSEEELRLLGLGGLLHDIGKLKIDVKIINKPGKLNDEEFKTIKTHPTLGMAIVKEMEGTTQEVIDIVHCHHLRYDRNGYPEDARGKKISRLVDMSAIADTYDAMTTMRSYQNPMTPRKAIEVIEGLAGSTLNPQFVERFSYSLGTYPVGTLVRLDTNEIGLVMEVGKKNPDDVFLKILFGKVGEKLPDPYMLELSGSDVIRITGEVDPFIKGIEVTDYFTK
ncbi:MAG: phosphohydrolase [Desulfuromonas sp.]|nr:MAG: phosphohydrolase [Desulfuromonas sp.]